VSSSARVQFGVALPTRSGGEFDGASIETAVEVAVRAERAGFDSVWAGESLLARPRFDPTVVLAAAAARTRRIALGTGVVLPALHAPVAFAQRMATLDQLSGGRLVIGTGIGVDLPATRREYATAAVPFEQRVGRLVETVRACRTLWSRSRIALGDEAPGRVTRYWDLRGVELATKPFGEAGPPFWVGATVQKPLALARAGRHFDGWFPTAPDATAYGVGLEEIRRIATDAGRSITGAVYLSVSLDDDAAKAETRLAAYLEAYYGLPFAVMRKVQGVFAGSVESCAAWLLGYVRSGATHLVLRGPSLASALDRIATQLVPLVRARVAETA
jgi:alkanesulfonate monooxygenase SsuD/methylene tetrahydromethanopterin reductase-like flavin-dependent oxidoreductase (luciferase family)